MVACVCAHALLYKTTRVRIKRNLETEQSEIKFYVQTVSRFLYPSEPLAPHALGLQLLMRLSEPLPLFTQRVTSTICVEGGMGTMLTIAMQSHLGTTATALDEQCLL